MKLRDIAAHIQGNLVGDGEIDICGANPLNQVVAGEITLLDPPKLTDAFRSTTASAVITKQQLPELSIPQVVVADAHRAFIETILLFRPARELPAPGIHRHAFVDPSAIVGEASWVAEGSSIGRDCVIGARCRIHRGVHIMDGCRLGDDCELFPGVVLYSDTQLGNRVLIHAGAVLGAYGFGYRQKDGRHQRTAQLGSVRLEDDVEIGAGSTIDRGTYGVTLIGEGTKIDNQVMIGHNVTIGKHNLICAQVGIAGSSSTGDYVVLAGQVGVKDHVSIGKGAVLAAQSGVAQDIEPGQAYMGAPAIPMKKYLQIFHLQSRLPQYREQIKALEKAVESLQRQIAGEDECPDVEDDRKVA